MDSSRNLHSDAHVRSLEVVEFDERSYHCFCLADVGEALPWIYEFLFDNAVSSFGNGIVGRFVVLGHAYDDVVPLQLVDIFSAAVLGSPVGVVHESRQIVLSRLPDGHPERGEGEHGHQRVGKAPSHDHVGVGVRYQVQVAASVFEADVRYVGDPHLVGPCGDCLSVDVLVGAETVVGVGGVPWLGPRKRQAPTVQQRIEAVAPGNPSFVEHVPEHDPELVASDAHVLLAYLPDGLYHQGLSPVAFGVVCLGLVVSLSAVAKQPASGID